MPLNISIDHSKLSDSPYDATNKSLYDFTKSDSEDFVQDLVYGNPTCYLISGYRGSGKTSFIKKLEEDIKAKENETLFVYLNFAKHEVRTILLRKLIRTFYLKLAESSLYKKLDSNSDLKPTLSRLKELHERTFFSVSKNTNQKKTSITKRDWGFKSNLLDLVLVLAAFVISITLFWGIDLKKWPEWIIAISPILALLTYLSIEVNRSKEQQKSSETLTSMLYDDEIAEHYLLESLRSLKDHLKVVFVLDELDKIENDEVAESLINELKPIMLSGLASFIVVAGQTLYYNFYASQTKDDGSLSSLFSKVQHIPLLSISELRLIFNKLIKEDQKQISNENKLILEAYCDFLVFESKRIPRRFISLIRQNIIWDNGQSYLSIDKSLDDLKVYSTILKIIKNIEDVEIESQGYPDPVRDYFIMQLLIKAHKILRSQNLFFTENEIFNYGK